jgi:predicted ATPase
VRRPALRVVVSGTHASGKSTLIADFAERHPEFAVLPDPFESLDENLDAVSPALFAAQLRVAAQRLSPGESPEPLVAERGPIDFLAYLDALDELGVAAIAREVRDRAVAMTRDALEHVDLLVVLPLDEAHPIAVGADEDPALRDAMDEALRDLVDDPDVVGDRLVVIEITGDRAQRLAAMEHAVERDTFRRTRR